MPMIATTIISSIKVNPECFEQENVCIACLIRRFISNALRVKVSSEFSGGMIRGVRKQ